MIRHCDGRDPNLVGHDGERSYPCACGRTFDDVSHSVVFPHVAIEKSPGVATLLRELGTIALDNIRLRQAIEAHRAQRSDDRCWEDDQRLYAALGDGNLGDNRVGDRDAMLANCRRFIERRCAAGGWSTYADLEAQLATARDLLRRIGGWDHMDVAADGPFWRGEIAKVVPPGSGE